MMDLYFSQHHGIISSGFDGLRISKADRQPCPVCGHPTGDCTDGTPPKHVIGFDSSTSNNGGLTIFVEEDIWEERPITPYTKARVLVYKKGASISQDEAKRLGLL
jgi:hypothetical protein